MSTSGGGTVRLAVGALELDPASGDLSGPSGVQRIAPQPAALLELLASRPGRVVTRREIREHLWPGGKVEFEQGIAFAVREVRKAIEAAGGDAAMIETIPKRGFRLATGEPAPPARTAPAPEAGADAVRADGAPTRPRATAHRRLGVGVALVALVAVAIAASVLASRGVTEPPPAVAVFEHTVEDAESAGLARALGFELTARLTDALAGGLGVVGPTGTAALADASDTEGARRLLGACLVVSGGIRAVGADSVVVFTQIVRTSDRVHAWAAQDTVPASAVGSAVPRIVEGVRRAAEGC